MGVDDVQPQVEAFEVTPTAGKAGTRFDLQLTANEALNRAPVVKMVSAVNELLGVFDLVSGDAAGTTFRFAYVAHGDEQQGPTRLYAEMVDRFGNLTERAPLGSIVLDFDPPAVVTQTEALRLTPALTNPLREVTAARSDTEVRVSFVMSEPLSADPVVSLTSAEAQLSFRKVEQLGNGYAFAGMPSSATPAQVTTELWVEAVDLVGNSSKARLSLTLDVDTLPPPAPVTDADQRIVLHRVPWGDDETHGVPRSTVRGQAGAVEPLTLVRFYDPVVGEIGTGESTTDGGFPETTLLGVDYPEVWLEAIDAAGNTSPRAKILDVEWTATLGHKVLGSLTDNPHRLESRPIHTEALLQSGGVELATGNVRGKDGGALTASALAWKHRLQPSAFLSGTYDSARARVVAYGSLEYFNAPYRVFEQDGEQWKPGPASSTTPGVRDEPAIAYDRSRGVTLLFGGVDRTPIPSMYYLGDTWLWDGSQWRDASRFDDPADGRPAARYGAAMAYDEHRRRMVLFGGNPGALNDTWEWDGLNWAPRLGDAPPHLDGQTMAYDPAARRMVLIGSDTEASTSVQWELTDQGWQERVDAGLPVLSNPALAYARERQSLLLLNATTLLEPGDGGWVPVALPPGAPTYGRSRPGTLVVDEARQRLVIMGRASANYPLTVELAADGGWRSSGGSEELPTFGALTMTGSITANTGSLVYDERRGQTVLFGGTTPLGETWVFDGARWNKSAPGPARARPALTYAPTLGGVLAFGGSTTTGTCTSETWLRNGVDAGWTLLTDAGTAPPCHLGASLTFDRLAGQAVLLGGTNGVTPLSDGWDLQPGLGWVQRFVSTPVGGWGYQRAVFDEIQKRVLVYGSVETCGFFGCGFTSSKLYALAGSILTPLSSAPGKRGYHALAHDHRRGLTLLFGGVEYEISGQGDRTTWLFDGQSWSVPQLVDITGDGLPPNPLPAEATWDRERERFVVVMPATSALNSPADTWELMGANATPSDVVLLDISGSRIPQGASVVSVRVNAVAGATGTAAGAPVSGAHVLYWNRGHWTDPVQPSSANTASSASPGDLSFVLAARDGGLDWHQLTVDRDTLGVAVVANAGADRQPATVLLNYFEGTVCYRLQP